MEPYDTGVDADPFVTSREVFECLVGEWEGEPAALLRHDRLEELVDARGRQVLRQLLQDHLDLRAVREEADLSGRLGPG